MGACRLPGCPTSSAPQTCVILMSFHRWTAPPSQQSRISRFLPSRLPIHPQANNPESLASCLHISPYTPKPTIQNLSLLAVTSRLPILRVSLLPTPHPLEMPYTLTLKTLHVLSRASSLPLVPHRAQHHAPKTCRPENFDANFRSYRAGLMRETQRQGHCSKPTTRLGNHRSRCSPRGIACMA